MVNLVVRNFLEWSYCWQHITVPYYNSLSSRERLSLFTNACRSICMPRGLILCTSGHGIDLTPEFSYLRGCTKTFGNHSYTICMIVYSEKLQLPVLSLNLCRELGLYDPSVLKLLVQLYFDIIAPFVRRGKLVFWCRNVQILVIARYLLLPDSLVVNMCGSMQAMRCLLTL